MVAKLEFKFWGCFDAALGLGKVGSILHHMHILDSAQYQGAHFIQCMKCMYINASRGYSCVRFLGILLSSFSKVNT